mmetsp:Transcript_13782/g.30031  ORF Transcript_13782/g.30031 Transcript_13782/m.30031 type:complete len:342 (-) Transcript_13782:57-1082(-)|eukprot:CAMPEP_0206581924 /NCGR_PEP_ID=MMETSP0325_2-20121206/34152_1 /ASSEMBLY_ACC=CAM_ASM_000347 /TAXON_ID=2866 /ORGANISM="Crypthecodinium cohnii, Strain Seligo" /LENGTH=341 /DNA_ID=CAMNT_0054088455 /DNA_START=184 /DNA_END=1209 /DNA_ORIENTATION=+
MSNSGVKTWGLQLGLLALLTVQNTGQAVLVKLSDVHGSRADTVSIMFLAEMVKAIVSLVLHLISDGFEGGKLRLPANTSCRNSVKLIPIAGMYAVQNQLLFKALHNLDPAVYQALSQLKILWAGVFCVILLGRRLSLIQWVSLLLLACGASLIQLESTMCGGKSVEASGNAFQGFLSVVVACVISGLAGCYTELMLKTNKMPMWLQSAQVALASAGLLGMLIVNNRIFADEADGDASVFDGFIPLTWAVLAMISLGGLTVVAVLRYADNLLKGISMVFSLLLSGVVSLILFDTEIGVVFVVAAIIICSSVFLYQATPAPPPSREEVRISSTNTRSEKESAA